MIKIFFFLLFLFLISFVKIILFFIKSDLIFSDLIGISSIIVNILVPVYIAHYLQNKFLKNTNLKSYHVKIIDDILIDYKTFVEDLTKGNLNRRDITNKFKNFTIRFDSVDNQNFKIFKIDKKLQEVNRIISLFITNSQEFNSTVTSSKVKFTNRTISILNFNYSKLLERVSDIIYLLHK